MITVKKPLKKTPSKPLSKPPGKPLNKPVLQRRPALKRRMSTADIAAVAICLIGAAAAFILFWRDLNKSLTKLNENPIANIYFKKNTAQRRFGDRVVWDVLQKDAPIYSGDVIHTSDLSEATIRFLDENGNETNSFDLAENSLIQVFDGKIELANGKIDIHTVTSGTQLKLVSAGTVIEIGANSTISANSIAAGGGNIQVLEGTALIRTVDGVQQAVAGEAMSVSAAGRQETLAQVVLLLPKPNQTILMSTTDDTGLQSVRFTWREAYFGQEDFTRFEVASDQRFSRILQTADVRNANEQTVQLAAGSYWWRAFPARDSGMQLDSSRFMSNKLTIIAAAPPKLAQPVDGSTIRFQSETPPSVRLQWTSGLDENTSEQVEQNYRVELADNLAMQNPRINQLVQRQNFFVVNDLGVGRWYWQVHAAYPENYDGAGLVAAVSRPASFVIERSGLGLQPPALLSPAGGAAVNLESGVMFSWQAEAEAVSYSVQIARSNEFVTPELNKKISTNFFNLTRSVQNMRDGVYYWRVAAVDSKGALSPYSELRSINLSTIAVPVELVSPRDNWTTSEVSLPAAHFSWKLNASGTGGRLHLQISETDTFNVLDFDDDVSGTELEAPSLDAGTYFWRLGWSAASGQSYNTPARRFTVTASSRITLEFPANNAELDGAELLRSPPSLRWNTSESVLRSRLVLSTRSNPLEDANPVLNMVNPPRSVQIPRLGQGVYYWTVQAETQGGISISALQPNSFRVGAPSLLEQVVLEAPRSGFVLNQDFLKTNRSINFRWRASSGANAYFLSIYRAADRSRSNPVFRSPLLKQNNFSFTNLAVLDNGAFIWTVEAVAANRSDELVQRGTLSEASFSVNIALPQSESLPNEETYGF